jgi:hypothetical protein
LAADKFINFMGVFPPPVEFVLTVSVLPLQGKLSHRDKLTNPQASIRVNIVLFTIFF